MPVFTGWRDHLIFDKTEKTTTATVFDQEWENRRPIGTANQVRWIQWAEDKNEGIAAFFVIHAENENAELRKVKYIDDDKVFIGKVIRDQGKVFIVGRPRQI